MRVPAPTGWGPGVCGIEKEEGKKIGKEEEEEMMMMRRLGKKEVYKK